MYFSLTDFSESTVLDWNFSIADPIREKLSDTDTYETHFDQRSTVFTRSRSAGLKINAEQCRFGITEIDHLGYIIAPTGIKPNTKKIKAIQQALKRPTSTTTESRRLIGMVT